MAGDWIKMRTNLRTHPKVVRMSSALQCNALHVIGALWAVWSIADEHAAVHDGAGHLDGYSLADMSGVIGFPGFAEQMAACGWVDECDEHAQNGGKCLIFKDFDTHNGKSAKSRAEDSERKRASRQSAERPESVRNLSGKRPAKSVTREEKRREEITPPFPAPAEVAGGGGEEVLTEEKDTAQLDSVCRMLEVSGITDTDRGSLGFVELVKAGVPDEAWKSAAKVAQGNGKGFAYLVGVVKRQVREAAALSVAGVPVLSGQMATDWRATRSGIDAKGVELGLGKWDQDAFEHGQGEPFARFEARVVAAAGGGEAAVVDQAGAAKVLSMIGKAFTGGG